MTARLVYTKNGGKAAVIHREECGHGRRGNARRWVKPFVFSTEKYRECGTCRPFHDTRIVNQWTGTRVLRRLDSDGTSWIIRRTAGDMWMLICLYRDHQLRSTHTSVEVAKAHRDDLTMSWRAARLRDYQQQRSTAVC